MTRRRCLFKLATVPTLLGGARGLLLPIPTYAAQAYAVVRTDAQWKQQLTPGQYQVLRHAHTEIPYSSPLNKEKRVGTFSCAGCTQLLFSSSAKFESGTGWPSFYQPIAKNAVVEKRDSTLGMTRIEVLCSRCGGHLGHVFDDGPQPTGLRYCMNGIALNFKEA